MTDEPKSLRIPPYSEEAERGVLGCILLAHEKTLDICDDVGLPAEAFYVPANGILYRTMLELHENRRNVVDVVTVSNKLRDQDALEACGGISGLDRLIDQTPTVAHAAYYIDIVLTKYRQRAMIDLCRRTEAEAWEDEDVEEISSRMELEISRLFERRSTPADIPEKALREKVLEYRVARVKGCAGQPTGFRVLDLYFGGLMDAALYIFTGPAASGKSTLARNICENLAYQRIPVAYKSFELTFDQLWACVNARYSRQSIFSLNRGDPKADIDGFERNIPEVSKLPIYVDDTACTPGEFRAWARRMKRKHGIQLIVIDYLQLFRHDARHAKKSQEEQIAMASEICRDVAKEIRIPIIAISAESYAGNLRGSGMIGYDAWCILRLQRSEDYEQDRPAYDVQFKKQRFGPPCNDTMLYMHGQEQRFSEEWPPLGDDVGVGAQQEELEEQPNL